MEEVHEADDGAAVALCASCDRCRSRKTKCDGKHPCNNCAAKFLKKNKVNSIDGFDSADIGCVYSPAKRRGPVPGRVGQTTKTGAQANPRLDEEMWMAGVDQSATALMQQQAALSNGNMEGARMMMLQQQAAMEGMGYAAGMDQFASQSAMQIDPLASMMQQLQGQMTVSGQATEHINFDQPSARRMRTEMDDNGPSTPDTVAAHLHLTSRDDPVGRKLRAFYTLSVDELFCLPPIPPEEDYNQFNPSQMLTQSHQAALQASRFAEIALGALVHNEVALAKELCNATVHCLRECVKDPVQPQYVFEVGRVYFLLGAFRAFRGDMDRYFKYRRVALTHVAKIDKGNGSELLLAAMAYLDAWAYMMFNANESKLPNIDGLIPRVSRCGSGRAPTSQVELQFGFSCNSTSIATDPKNQMWIQGVPPVYLNNEAPLTARTLDALSCAIRSCCDQANTRFLQMSREAEPNVNLSEEFPESIIETPTSTAVLAHGDELCSRNMVISAFTLLQQHEATTGGSHRNEGLHLIISAMGAFLENGDESGGFSDSQIQSLLSVCNNAIENPLLLHHGGPTYHLVTNAAILLCHLLNGMHAQGALSGSKEMEAAVFEEVVDTFISVRKLLNIHRRKLPVKLRCHGIPRPSLNGPENGQPFINLGDTLMCGCRGCQGFVLMACSPCVAAERARNALQQKELEVVQESMGVEEACELDQALHDLESEFDLDDDDLLNILSRIITA